MRFEQQPNGCLAGEAIDGAKLRALRVAGVFLFLGPALYLTLIALSYPDQLQRGLGPALVMILAAATLLLLRTGRMRTATWVLVYGVFAGLVPTMAMNGGLQAPQTVALPLAILLAGWLLGVCHAMAMTALTLTLALSLGAYPVELPSTATQLPLSVFPIVVVLLITGLLTAYIVRSNDSRLDEVRRLGEALAAEKSQLAQIAENIPAFIFHGDRDLHCRFANRRYAEFFGFTPENILGKSVADILGEESARAIQSKLQSVLSGEGVQYNAVRRSAVDDKEHHLDISFVPEHDESGKVVGFYALKLDVTDRHHAERALAESEAHLRLVTENVPAMIAYNDRDLVVRYVNPRFLAFFGLGREAAVGRPIRDIIGDEAFQKSEPLLRRALAGDAVSYRAIRQSAAGEARIIEVDSVPDRGDDGAVRGAYALMRDITDQQRAEDEVRRLNADLEQRVSERTAELQSANKELESFAYSISHDLRAPLRGIDGFSHLLAEEFGDTLDETGRGYLDRVRRAAQRMGTLIDDILELSRVTRQEMRRVRVDLSRIAAEVIDERARADPGHRVECAIAPDCRVFGDPQLLRVMLQNLLENAWKYSGKEAAPRIEFGQETIDGETIFFVRDNGVGFDMKYADRLFTPFQRLHKPEEFEGTGIGLATVARIVRRHGGRAWAESTPGQGTIVRFTL
jgi:PAS domain S-box-containing protein